MSPVGGRPFPVRPLVVAALLMIVLSGLSLDRADKLAGIGGLFVALAGFLYTYRHGGAGPADPSAGSTPLPGGTRQRFGTALFHRYAGRLRPVTVAFRIGGRNAVRVGTALGRCGLPVARGLGHCHGVDRHGAPARPDEAPRAVLRRPGLHVPELGHHRRSGLLRARRRKRRNRPVPSFRHGDRPSAAQRAGNVRDVPCEHRLSRRDGRVRRAEARGSFLHQDDRPRQQQAESPDDRRAATLRGGSHPRPRRADLDADRAGAEGRQLPARSHRHHPGRPDPGWRHRRCHRRQKTRRERP